MLACTGYAAQSQHEPPSRPSASSGATPGRATSRCRSSSAASATATCTWPATSGAIRSTPWCPATRSSGAWSRSARRSPSSVRGDRAGVGVIVDSCGHCGNCREGLEIYCDDTGPTPTYAGEDRKTPGLYTQGGYSKFIVTDEHFVHRIPDGPGLRRRSAPAVRRHHDLLAATPLGRGTGPESRHRRLGWARPYGFEVRTRLRRTHGAVHHLARQGGGGAQAGSRRGDRITRSGRRWPRTP